MSRGLLGGLGPASTRRKPAVPALAGGSVCREDARVLRNIANDLVSALASGSGCREAPRVEMPDA